MSYQQILQKHREHIPMYVDIGRKELIRWEFENNRQSLRASFGLGQCKYPLGNQLLQLLYSANLTTNTIEVYTAAKIMSQGLKVYKIKTEEAEALENVDINIGFEDYHQPFPAFIIELPKDYYQSKIVPNAIDSTHKPTTIAICNDDSSPVICVSIYFDDTQAMNFIFWDKCPGTIEQNLQELFKTGLFKDSLPTDKNEVELCHSLMKMGLNVCLMMMQIGVKKIGPENPEYYERLKKYFEKAQKQNDQQKMQKVNTEMRIMPQVYDLERHVKLYEDQRVMGRGPHNPTGRQMPWHWRRGHHHIYRHGPGKTLRKVLLVKPIIINAHLIGGDDVSTTIYEK